MRGKELSPQKSTTGRFNFVHSGIKPILGSLSRLAPGPASDLAMRLFLKPPRVPAPMREHWWSAEAEMYEIPFGSGKLAVWSWGWSGPRVLLVHGWAGRGRQLGAFAEQLVEAGFQVITYDAPGHGLSSGKSSSLPALVDAVSAIVRHYSGVSAIVAHSLGAAATTLALGRPGTPLDVERLVYIASPADITQATDRFGEMTGFSQEVLARLRAGLEERFAFDWQELHPLHIAPKMDTPLMVVHDRGDRDIPWEHGEALANAWPGARLVSTEGLGHRKILRDPGVVATVVEYLRASRFSTCTL